MKLLDIIKGANSNLFRNKTRTFLTILAVFIGSFTIILNSAINTGVNSFIDKQVESIGGDGYMEIMPSAVSEQVSSMLSGNSSVLEYNPNKGSAESAAITKDDLEKIRALDGVEKAETFHNPSIEYITSGKTSKKYQLTAALAADNTLNVDMSAGKQVDADSKEPEIMISEDYVKPLGFDSPEAAVGQTVTLATKQTAKCYTVENPEDCLATAKATITGVMAPGVLSFGGGARVNPALNDALYDLQMEGVPDSIKDKAYFVTAYVNPDKVDEIKIELEKLGFSGMTVDDEAGMIRTFFDVILVVFNIFGAIALIAASIGIINTLFMSVQERTREIGLMKALGMSNAKIFLSFSFEAVLIGFWGSVVGILLSMLVGYSGNELAHQTFLKEFPTFNLVEFTPLNMGIIVLVIMAIAFLAGTAPARAASRKDPIDALRYE